MNLMGFVFIIGSSIALFMGGKPVAGGFFLSYEVISRTVNFTPSIAWKFGENHDADTQMYYAQGFTLGSVIFVNSSHPDILKYELGHVQGYMHFGAEYVLQTLANPCDYDPAAAWARCGWGMKYIRLEQMSTLNAQFSAFSIKF